MTMYDFRGKKALELNDIINKINITK